MLADHTSYRLVRAVVSIGIDVTFFWQRSLYSWWTKKPAKAAFTENLAEANLFEEWEAAAFQLDELNGHDLWRQNPTSKYYDYRLIYERLQAILDARDDDDILGLVNLLRSGLVRNLGNITSSRLFNKAYAGTKLLIEEYITQVALAVDEVASYPTSSSHEQGLTNQAKLDLLHDTRQAFGRSALVLQGGSIFGLCHIGVVKALHLHGLLPRIIVGTGTGALIAALVGVHGEDELLEFLTAERIDLSAFAARRKKSTVNGLSQEESTQWWATLQRRLHRLIKEGYFLDVTMLEACVHANVGDMTFEEAYIRTGRVLNITVPADLGGDVPNLLNYLTAPNVLIWSAAVASNVSPTPLYHPVKLLCKDPNGNVTPWSTTSRNSSPTRFWKLSYTASTSSGAPSPASAAVTRSYESLQSTDLRYSPLSRVAELFNVNHFLVSQARPYIAPFLQTGDHNLSSSSTTHHHHSGPAAAAARTTSSFYLPLLRVLVLEIQHRLRQLDALGLLHVSVRRFLIDEIIPGPSLTLVPELHAKDFWGLLFERPTRKSVDEWILRGERSVWPAVSALKVRCAVEVELDRCYQVIRRKKPMDAVFATSASSYASKRKGINGSVPEAVGVTSMPGGAITDDAVKATVIGAPLVLTVSAPQQSRGHLKGTGEKRKRQRANSANEGGKRMALAKEKV